MTIPLDFNDYRIVKLKDTLSAYPAEIGYVIYTEIYGFTGENLPICCILIPNLKDSDTSNYCGNGTFYSGRHPGDTRESPFKDIFPNKHIFCLLRDVEILK